MGTNTGLGIGIGIPFKNNALGGDKPYFPPELKARMIGVWTNYGKKNTDVDRNIIKNKIPNAGGDLEILNAAYKLNSGFGEYKVDFLDWTINSSFINERTSFTFSSFNDTNNDIITVYQRVPAATQSFLIKAKLRGRVLYRYYVNNGDTISVSYYEVKEGINILPDSVDPTSVNGKVGFVLKGLSSIKVEQIPNFEDAFVTDGINDIIISQKTLQEMGVTKELTIVSMIHQISWRGSASISLTNYIRNGDTFIRNSISNIGKTGIYGYTCFNIKNVNSSASKVINNILGDKNDYIVEYRGDILSERFSVQGYIDGNGNIGETSSVAHYWTFAVLGKVTEDEINLIIGNYNLDRSLEPDILCNIGKQGITNDNHADFNDKLVDYSGNSRDIQTYNLAWKGGSGIAAKPFETIKDYTIVPDETRQKLTIYNEFSYKVRSNAPNYYWIVQSIIKDNTSYQVTIITDKDCYWVNATSFTNSEGNKDNIKKEYPVKANTPTQVTICGLNEFEYPEGIKPTTAVSYVNLSYAGEITVTFIPSYKGGLLLDGINDFGKVTGMPIYKDYTFIIDREIISIGNTSRIVASKSEDSKDVNKQGAFLFEYLGAPNNISAWSFYKNNGKVANTDFTRGISYQSKYSYNGIELLAGTALDSDKLWLGIFRDKDSRFANVAIYSLMSFPYTMSKFLIERQLKKHKLGTLYPDMVELRPIAKSNVKWNIIEIWQGGKSLYSSAVNDYKTGIYLKKDSTIGIYVKPKDADEVTKIVVNGTEYTNLKINSNGFYYVTLPITKSPQKINITIDEYIRYEDIVQPYPVVFQIKDRTTNQIYSWGDKIKVGSSIRLSQGENPNLLNGLYSIRSYEYEGKTYSYNQLTNLNITVTKQSISLSCNKIWLLDNNEPKCILSPRLLRIPNSSYKILGYIPDISGHGNHGKINNSAYAGASGANGYLQNFSEWTKASGVSSTDSVISSSNNLVAANGWIAYVTSGTVIPTFKVEISGIPVNGNLRFEGSDQTLVNGVNTIQGITTTKVTGFYISSGYDNDWSNLKIEQIGEYEGAYCLDGVDDFVTIPTVTGGKQVLMKVNWLSDVGAVTLYDQRLNISDYEFAIYNGTRDLDDNPVMAYQGRNNGQTYIDGILNSNIMASELKAITHNITITNELSLGINNTYPVIGSTRSNTHFAQMSLYDFMLFDNISTDDKIKELNEYVGVEAKVELPPYYWDTYGKTNSDADRDTIQQRGVATGDYDLTNYNHAYEGMSGYNGYPVVFGANKTWESLSGVYGYTSDVTNTTIHVTHAEHVGNGLLFSYVKKDGALANIKEIPAFRVTIGGLEGNSKFGYRYLATEDATGETLVYLGNGTHELAKSFAPTEALLDLTRNVWVGIFITPMVEGEVVFDCDITIEVLPEYENGLAYDGVEDYSVNTNIPALTDYTYIIKRENLNNNVNSATMYKGNKAGGGAFIVDYIASNGSQQYSYGNPTLLPLNENTIIYGTKTSYNGSALTVGSNTDENGLDIGHWSSNYKSIVLYKLILYSKTIPLLQINFLKNLMEKDEIIDLNNPIFIKNE